MRPAEAAPVAPFANSPLRQHPNDCVSDCRGIPDPVAPFKPPCLISQCTGGASARVLSCERYVKQHTQHIVRRIIKERHTNINEIVRGNVVTCCRGGKQLRRRPRSSDNASIEAAFVGLQWSSIFKLRA